ncbi:MAG TPA: L,D-transpeptidase family protein, partial [Methyloceanibacter sp.]|nr:L,D-transpeptidase family protein [Methyloceanibacter sp.]
MSLPAEAQKRKNQAPAEATLPDPVDGEPMTLVVSLGQQKVDIYRGLTLVTSSSVSTGMRGHATKAGVFSILEKKRMHHSNLYSGAPMPWMNRITWSGTALHAGVVPGYPASHGCIRLPFSFAPKLFKITTVGDNVIVARDRPAPQIIEHPNLFQPLSPASLTPMVKEQEPPKHQTENEVLPVAPQKERPRMLARADVSNSATDVPSVEAEAVRDRNPAPPRNDPAAVEDTHAHAFDPRADGPAEASHDKRSKDPAAKAPSHALDEEGAPETSFARDEAAPARSAAERAATSDAPAPTQVRHTEPAPASAPSPTVTATAQPNSEIATPAPVLPATVPAAAAALEPAETRASAANTAEPASGEAKAEPAAQALAALPSPVPASPL